MSKSHTTSPCLTASPNSTETPAFPPANDNATPPRPRWHTSVTEIPRLGLWEAIAIDETSGMRYGAQRANRAAAIAEVKAQATAWELVAYGVPGGDR